MFRQIEQWNRIESPKTNPYIYGHLIFDKGEREFNGEEQSFQQIMLGQLDIHVQKMKSYPYFTPYTNFNSKLVVDLNVRAKTMKLLEENLEVNLCDLGLGNCFLEITQKNK